MEREGEGGGGMGGAPDHGARVLHLPSPDWHCCLGRACISRWKGGIWEFAPEDISIYVRIC